MGGRRDRQADARGLYNQRADQGKCTRCGKFPPVEKGRLCRDCLEKHRRGQRRWQVKCEEKQQTQREAAESFDPVAVNLCDTCKFATAIHCEWIGRDDISGITIRKKFSARETSFVGYYVCSCKRYAWGTLPAIPRSGIYDG